MTDPSREEEMTSQAVRPVHDMRLRTRRPPVTRLSRKVLLGIGAVAAIAIGGASLFALKPQHQPNSTELYNTNTTANPSNPTDALANLPHDYSSLPKSVPQLGPPLPGDLGKPILNASARTPGTPPSASPEEQRLAQEQEAARTSNLFAKANAAPVAVAPSSAASPSAATPANASPDVASQDHKLAFLNGSIDRRAESPDRVQAPASPYILQSGAVIPASLITGLRSDLPGEITAQVTENVYDSPTGKILLIPQGARLIGQYDAQISFGQSRALLVWNRLILPNGRSLVLERQPGADTEGYAGVEDQVDSHWGMLLKAAILSTILSVGSEAGISGNNNGSLAQAIQQGVSQSVNQTGQQVVSRSLNIQPTITIRPGFEVRVLVTHDLVLEPYHG